MSDTEQLFNHWLHEGWKFRKIGNNPEYKKRMKYEFDIISSKPGFVDYFCIVSDIVRWTKRNGIMVGPGRGSGAASLIAYLLQITEIDPVPTQMMFERFIDPQRSDLPDFDIDIEDERRHEVFAYAAEKYGRDYVANIGTFTYYKGKNSLDDVARVYRIPKWAIDNIKAKLITRPEGHAREYKTITDTIDTYQEIKALVKRFPQLEYAPKLEGNIRNFGVHAAGLVISPIKINDVCATYMRNGVSAIAYDKYDAVYLNLVKIDLLSLKTLSMMRIALSLIGKGIKDLYELPLNDPKVLAAFERGNVLGIFQMEGQAARRICKNVQPVNFGQLADICALARPGAMASGGTEDYVRRRHGQDNWGYAHPIIEQYTANTFGIIVYQEQVLGILKDLGDFPPSAINKIRGVIQYKLGEGAFNELFEEFIKGSSQNGLDRSEATNIWSHMVSSAGYSFNYAHSISYGKIAYWSMFLKIHHPAAFYTAALIKNGDGKDDIPRMQKLMREAKSKGIVIAPPNVSYSNETWTYVPGDGHQFPERIIAGFTQVKGIGERTAERMLSYRQNNDIDDWDDYLNVKGIGPKTIETIKEFCDSDDPFGLGTTGKILDSLRQDFNNNVLIGVPAPTHNSSEIVGNGTPVVFMGVPQKVKYYDAIEQLKKRSKEELSTEEALRQLDSPDLIKYCTIQCEDDFGETVFIRLSRWTYPKYSEHVSELELGRDVIIAKGVSSEFGGISVQTKELFVIDPYED